MYTVNIGYVCDTIRLQRDIRFVCKQHFKRACILQI